MAKVAAPELPFTRKNWILFGTALGTIALGYVLLSIGSAEGFLSLTLAPVLLVAGYCALVPAAILVRESPEDTAQGAPTARR
jgi:hypothetical protein